MTALPDQPINILVAIASGRDAKWPFPVALANLMTHTVLAPLPKGTKIHLEVGRTFDTAQCRRRLVASAKEHACTHILFIDDDMDFPRDSLVRLAAHGKEIVGANYTCRGFPVEPLAMKNGRRVSSRNGRGLESVDWIPTGLMLIDMRVFDKIDKPYFEAPCLPGEDGGMSDDVYFCRKATAAGIEVWVDHDLSQRVYHIGDAAYGHAATADQTIAQDILDECEELLK